MKIAVKNFDNKTVKRARSPRGDLRLPVQGAPDPHGGAGVPRGPARRDAQDQDAQRGLGLRQEALEAEGHRPGAHGRHPQPALAPGRHGSRSGAARLQPRICRRARRRTRSSRRSRARRRRTASSSSRASTSRRRKTKELAAILDQARRRGQGPPGGRARQREPRARVAQPSGDRRRWTRWRSTSTTSSTGPIWWSARRRSAASWRCSEHENPGDHPASADHREVDACSARARTCSTFEVDSRANKIEIQRAVEAQFKVKVAEVRVAKMHGKVRRQGRFAGRRPDWKKAYVRLAPARRRSTSSRACKEESSGRWVFDRLRPINASSRFQTFPDFDEITASRPLKSLTSGKTATGGRNNQGPADHLVPRRRTQAPLPRRSTSSATSTAFRARSRRSSTIRTARRASR